MEATSFLRFILKRQRAHPLAKNFLLRKGPNHGTTKHGEEQAHRDNPQHRYAADFAHNIFDHKKFSFGLWSFRFPLVRSLSAPQGVGLSSYLSCPAAPRPEAVQSF